MTFDLQEQLEKRIGKKLVLKINDNRSTMVSVRWEPKETKVSLHKMFLDAPQYVVEELVGYIKKKKTDFSPAVKEFIQEGLKTLDYSHRVKELIVQGKYYNLEEIYDTVESTYFKKPLKLKITWYGKETASLRSSITLGQYHSLMKLIKMHRVLDTPKIPRFILEFIVYHEMLHDICDPFVDHKGNSIVHTPAFKAKEKEFERFDEVERWMKRNQHSLFEI